MDDGAELVTLVLPQFLQTSLQCFTREEDEDITHKYNINLRTPEGDPLYIDNEGDLRDMLKQYCLYKQLCAKVDEEMRIMDLEFHLDDKNVRLIRTQDARGNFCQRAQQIDSSFIGCDPSCYDKSASKPVTVAEIPKETHCAHLKDPCPDCKSECARKEPPPEVAPKTDVATKTESAPKKKFCCIIL